MTTNPETAGVEPVALAKAFIADYKMNMSCWPHEKALRVAANRVLGPALAQPAAVIDAIPPGQTFASTLEAIQERGQLVKAGIRPDAHPPAAREDGEVELWRHKKRGTFYEKIGVAELQCAHARYSPGEGDGLVVYRGDDGKLWARMAHEFHDGRFELATTRPAPEQAPDDAKLLTLAADQNDAMRQEIANVGNRLSDLARVMGVDQANDDGTWPDLSGRIDKLIAAARAPDQANCAVGERAISDHPCHGLFAHAGDRLTHRHWFQGGNLMSTCERCGTLIDREHKEVGPVSWVPEKRRETITLQDRYQLSQAAMSALGEWLAWPDAGRDGPREVTVEQTLSFLRGLPNKLGYDHPSAALAAMPTPAAIRAEERERCAKIADHELVEIFDDSPEEDALCNVVVREIAKNIRAGEGVSDGH